MLAAHVVVAPGFKIPRLIASVDTEGNYTAVQFAGVPRPNLAEVAEELVELALKSNLPGEAKKVIDAGYAAGVLGTGSNAALHKKQRDQAVKSAADDVKNATANEAAANKSKDGTGLVNLGFAFVTTDQFDKGIELMQKGIAKGGLKRPAEARLQLAEAYAMAGRKDEAIKAFEGVTEKDGSGDLARYWIMWLNRPGQTAAAAPAAK